jgi:hypothetical protein
MTATITYSLSADFEDGPSVLKTATIAAGAYDYVEETVPADDEKIVQVQPGEIEDFLIFMMVSDNYTDLTFTVDAGSPVVFDGPVVLVGAGAAALLGATCAEITFTNADTKRAANIMVFVARVAEEAP